MLSSIDTRIFVWIKIYGKYHGGDWYSCRLSDRLIYFLKIQNLDYTISSKNVFFSWLHDTSVWTWDIDIESAIDEIRVIRSYTPRVSFKLSPNEQLIMITQASNIHETVSFKLDGSLDKIMKSNDYYVLNHVC